MGRTIQTLWRAIPRILLHFFIHIPNMHGTYQKKYRILPIFLPAESADPISYLLGVYLTVLYGLKPDAMAFRGMRIMLEKVADSARKAVKLAEPYKPYGGQFLEFCSISLSTYQTCMKHPRKSTEFCQFCCRHYPPAVLLPTVNWELVARHKGYMDAANGVVFGTCASGCETCPLTPTVRRCICR